MLLDNGGQRESNFVKDTLARWSDAILEHNSSMSDPTGVFWGQSISIVELEFK